MSVRPFPSSDDIIVEPKTIVFEASGDGQRREIRLTNNGATRIAYSINFGCSKYFRYELSKASYRLYLHETASGGLLDPSKCLTLVIGYLNNGVGWPPKEDWYGDDQITIEWIHPSEHFRGVAFSNERCVAFRNRKIITVQYKR